MMKKIALKIFAVLLFGIIPINVSSAQGSIGRKDLSIHFAKDAKIEIGSFYAGLEFHHSHPLPQRISFYYPVANSVDLSTDYWKRDTTFVMQAGISSGGKTEWLDSQSLPFDHTPFSAEFYREDDDKSIEVSYAFTKNKPAFTVTYKLTNKSGRAKDFEIVTRQVLTFRTSHTFNWSRKVELIKENDGRTVFVHHDDPETKNATMFILSPGNVPSRFSFYDSGKGESAAFTGNPYAEYSFGKSLAPGESFTVTQIIGTCYRVEETETAAYLARNYKSEVSDFEKYILGKISRASTFSTGDSVLDRSVLWAKAILEVNKHYIDGEIMPMPCPAEYNFYFTHDVLLTDLAAVNFDLPRVKNDLRFIQKLANKDKIIPHAYYWKDSAFVTEFADHDNWNNFWFIIVSSEYLKHSGDADFVKGLYPYLEKSLKQAMLTKGADDLMWSYRPDWWDIGRRYGQRSYMTILAVKALKSFVYLSSALGKNIPALKAYEELADRMTAQLNSKLFMGKYGYLMNYTGPDTVDEHYYSGSLLAAHYGLTDKAETSRLVETAGEKIVDDKVGVYTVFPMDFDKLQDFWHLVNNEAGDKYYYLNGGIWPQSNAWYALALSTDGRKEKAAEFIRNVMTIDGIMNGPNGQPAMYEVRNGNASSPSEYGTIDKPQFMWAGGWYLYSLYYLFGLDNNEWNIQFNPFLGREMISCSFDLTAGGKLNHVSIGKGSRKKVKTGVKEINSFVLPAGAEKQGDIYIQTGKTDQPMLVSTNSVLKSCSYKNNILSFRLAAFAGHQNVSSVISPSKPQKILLNGKLLEGWKAEQSGADFIITVPFGHIKNTDEISIQF